MRTQRQMFMNLALLFAVPAAGLIAVAILSQRVPQMAVAIDYITTSSIP